MQENKLELVDKLMEEVEHLLIEDAQVEKHFDAEIALLVEDAHDAALLTEGTFGIEDELLVEKNVMKLDKQAKIRMKVAKRAIEIAKKSGSPLYKKYKKYITLKVKFEKAILKKYRQQALRDVRTAVKK